MYWIWRRFIISDKCRTVEGEWDAVLDAQSACIIDNFDVGLGDCFFGF